MFPLLVLETCLRSGPIQTPHLIPAGKPGGLPRDSKDQQGVLLGSIVETPSKG